MFEATVIINDEVGLHARPAAALVSAVAKFKSTVTLEVNGKKAIGKSILQIASLGAKKGDSLLTCAEGDDEVDAVMTLTQLINFGIDKSL